MDISKSLDSKSRKSQELFGGGRLLSVCVSARLSLKFFLKCLDPRCISLSIISQFLSIWQVSPFTRRWFSWFGLLFSGIRCVLTWQYLNGFELGDDGIGCTVQHAWLSVIPTIFIHQKHERNHTVKQLYKSCDIELSATWACCVALQQSMYDSVLSSTKTVFTSTFLRCANLNFFLQIEAWVQSRSFILVTDKSGLELTVLSSTSIHTQ